MTQATQTMQAKCGALLTVVQTSNSFELAQECPAKQPPGTDIQTLMSICLSCPQAAEQIPTAPQQPTPATVETPIAKPEPEPEPELPMPAPPVPLAAAPAERKVTVVRKDAQGNEVQVLPSPAVPPPGPAIPAIPEVPAQAAPTPDIAPSPPAADPAGLPQPTLPPPGAPPMTADATTEDPKSFALTEIILPGGFTLDPKDETAVDIDAVLSSIDGYKGGPSQGGLSSHILADVQQCPRRCWWHYIQGVVPAKFNYNLQFGSLLHGSLAMRYLHGAHRQNEPMEKAIQAGAAEMGRDCRTLVDGMVDKFGDEERDTWCPRAVEENVVFHLPRQRIAGKSYQIPICARVDLILALKDKSEPVPGLGPAPQGAYVLDHKTTSGATYNLVMGYGMDFQMKTYAMAYIMGGLEAVHGPFQGIMINLLTKRKKAKPEHFQRARAPYSTGNIKEFLDTEITPAAVWLWERLVDTNYHTDKDLWPKRTTQCIGRWGLCDYFDVCDGGSPDDPSRYKRDPDEILIDKLGSFAEPDKKAKSASAGSGSNGISTPEEETKKAKKEAKKALQKCILDLYAQGLLAQLENPGYEPLRKDQFLTPGHNQKGVEADLAKALQTFYDSFITGKQKHNQDYSAFGIEGTVSMAWQKSGIKWACQGHNGRLTWKQISGKICILDWFNLAKIRPEPTA